MPGWRDRMGPWLGKGLRDPFSLALVFIVLLGAIFRLRGVVLAPISGFWGDESLWAPRVTELSLLKMHLRPIGFMAVTRAIVSVFGHAEWVYRSLPLLGGLLVLGFSPYVASQLFKSRWAQLLFVVSVAFCRPAIDMSREFKPYGLEGFLHLLPILLFLRYRQTDRARWLWAMVGVLPLLFLMGFSIAVALPCVLLVALWWGWKARRTKGALVVVGAGILCLAVVGGTYHTVLSKVHRGDKTTRYWAKKYKVFYRAPTKPNAPWTKGHARWLASKYFDVAAFPGDGRKVWRTEAFGEARAHPPKLVRELAGINWAGWLLLHFIGLGFLFRKRRYDLIGLLWGPIVVTAGLSIPGLWPFSNFRTDFYLTTYTLCIAGLGMDVLVGQGPRWRTGVAVGAIALFTMGPRFLFESDGYVTRTWHTYSFPTRRVLPALAASRRELLKRDPKAPPTTLVIDFSATPLKWYFKYDPWVRDNYGDFFEKNFRLRRSDRRIPKTVGSIVSRSPGSAWVVAIDRGSRDRLLQKLRARVKVLEQHTFNRTRIFRVAKK
ncbi:MAG: glycosyltransferase family 39 protein [Myxococcota bacterium]